MKVYIVDDTSFVRIICRYHLEKAGFEIVGEAYDGLLALKEIQALQPECVIMDLALPGMNGVQIMREIQADFPQIKFLVISALDKEIFERTADDLHYEGFMAKPFDGNDLVNRLVAIKNSQKEKDHG